jgi:hypothetical protein
MIAFAGMLVEPAKKAGITVPSDPDNFDPDEYPHWNVYLNVQIGAGLPTPDSHWHNAEVVAAVPAKQIKKVTLEGLIRRGLSIST